MGSYIHDICMNLCRYMHIHYNDVTFHNRYIKSLIVYNIASFYTEKNSLQCYIKVGRIKNDS